MHVMVCYVVLCMQCCIAQLCDHCLKGTTCTEGLARVSKYSVMHSMVFTHKTESVESIILM